MQASNGTSPALSSTMAETSTVEPSSTSAPQSCTPLQSPASILQTGLATAPPAVPVQRMLVLANAAATVAAGAEPTGVVSRGSSDMVAAVSLPNLGDEANADTVDPLGALPFSLMGDSSAVSPVDGGEPALASSHHHYPRLRAPAIVASGEALTVSALSASGEQRKRVATIMEMDGSTDVSRSKYVITASPQAPANAKTGQAPSPEESSNASTELPPLATSLPSTLGSPAEGGSLIPAHLHLLHVRAPAPHPPPSPEASVPTTSPPPPPVGVTPASLPASTTAGNAVLPHSAPSASVSIPAGPNTRLGPPVRHLSTGQPVDSATTSSGSLMHARAPSPIPESVDERAPLPSRRPSRPLPAPSPPARTGIAAEAPATSPAAASPLSGSSQPEAPLLAPVALVDDLASAAAVRMPPQPAATVASTSPALLSVASMPPQRSRGLSVPPRPIILPPRHGSAPNAAALARPPTVRHSSASPPPLRSPEFATWVPELTGEGNATTRGNSCLRSPLTVGTDVTAPGPLTGLITREREPIEHTGMIL